MNRRIGLAMAFRLVPAMLLAIVIQTSALAKVPAPNGRIAFDRSEGEALLTINPDGSDERVLFAPSCCPRWSPDGTQFVFPWLTQDGMFTSAIANADGSGLRVLPAADATLNMDGGVFSPDGRWLAVEAWDDTNRGRNGLYLRRTADGGGLTRVTYNPFGDPDMHGDFSPDGGRIAFIRSNPQHAGARAIFVVNTDGTEEHQVTPWGMAGCCAASWSPDGRWILFDARGNLYLVQPDGTALKQIVLKPGSRHWAFEPAWSPDGTHIAFTMYVLALGQDDIYTAKVDGSDLFQVTNTPKHEGQADWGAAAP